MNKARTIISLAVLVIGLLGSCSKINERLDGLDKRINNLEYDKIASVEQQIAAINQSIADLGTIRTNIQTLMDAKEAQGEDITALKAANQNLEGKIAELKAFLDTDLAKFATTEWVNATFATLEKQAEIIADVTKLKQDLAGLDAELDQAIADLDSSLKAWVNEQLSAYSTTAQMEAKIKALQDQIDTLKTDNETNKSDIEELEAGLAQLEQDLAAAKATIKTAYEKAIEDALKGNDGYITEKIKTDISSVNGSISDLTSKVRTLDTKVANLRGDVDALKKMIQSVTIIPAYSDGSVEADEDGIVHIDCIISPASAVSSLTKANFTVLVNKDGAITSSPITKDEWFSKVASKGTVSLKVPVDITASDDNSITVAVKVNYKHNNTLTSDITTDFVPVTVVKKSIKTIADVLATVADGFPNSSSQTTIPDNAWVADVQNNRKCYAYTSTSGSTTALLLRIPKVGEEDKGNYTFILTSLDVTKENNCYTVTYNDDFGKLTFNMAENILTSINYEPIKDGANPFGGTYAAPPTAN